LHGRLEFIRDLVTYEGTDAGSQKQAFHPAVDDCLALCAERGRKPDVRSKAATTCGRAATSTGRR